MYPFSGLNTIASTEKGRTSDAAQKNTRFDYGFERCRVEQFKLPLADSVFSLHKAPGQKALTEKDLISLLGIQ